MRHIALLLPDLRGGGAERVMVDLATEFRAAGIRITFVLRKAQGELLDDARAVAEVVELNADRLRYAYAPLRRWLRTTRPDAIIANLWPNGAMAVLAARGTGAKVVVVEHSMLSHQYSRWGGMTLFKLRQTIRHMYPRAHAIVGVSAGVARDVEALGSLPAGTVRVIHNPVREAAMVTEDAEREAKAAWSSGEGPRILTVGNLKAVKNHALLLRAFARMQALPSARLLILGEGELRGELEGLAKGLGISNRVSLPGFRADPGPFYAAADLFVLSSDYEGFGNVVVEALSHGVQVVSTDCPSGPSEILEGGRYGRLVPVGDEAALAAAIRAVLAEARDPAPLVARAADFAPARAAAKYLELLA